MMTLLADTMMIATRQDVRERPVPPRKRAASWVGRVRALLAATRV